METGLCRVLPTLLNSLDFAGKKEPVKKKKKKRKRKRTSKSFWSECNLLADVY